MSDLTPSTAREPAADAARRAAAHVIVADLDHPELDPEDRHHLEGVLRVRPGEAVSLTDGRGGWRLGRLERTGELLTEGDPVRQPRPVPAITVGLALVKGDRPEWAVQKLTELGVDRIVLLHTARTVVRWDARRVDRHIDRLQTVARQAVMQSRGWWVPEVVGVEPVDALISGTGVAIAAPGGDPPSLEFPTVLVGPEGGWSPAEEQSAPAAVALGSGILRTETAAVAAGVLLAALRAGLAQQAP
ncbi:MAG TPA: RsmE family RNA methyltransferase [Acidimicrobiales bacterium]